MTNTLPAQAGFPVHQVGGHGTAILETAVVLDIGPRNAIDVMQGREGAGERGMSVLCIATPFKNDPVRGCSIGSHDGLTSRTLG
jgi:hypothetical protein